MATLSSLTKTQWLILLALLAINVMWTYAGAMWLALSPGPHPEPPTAADSPAGRHAVGLALAIQAPTVLTSTATRTPSRTPTSSSTKTPATGNTPKRTATRRPSATHTPTKRPMQAGSLAAPRTLADLELDPRALLTSKTTFFTSACFGEGANRKQDQDFMTPGDWSESSGRDCVFGYRVSARSRLPSGRYSTSGGPGGQARFYLIPPEAFAYDQQSLKQLSGLQLIVDPEQGCSTLGSIGMTADGATYWCSACAFLRAGGACQSGDGSKALVLPHAKESILTPDETGGAYGFQGFPLLIFRKGFSLYLTGKDGFAPPRIYFESAVATLLPNVRVKTTAEMTAPEVREIASQFDHLPSGVDPVRELAALEHDVPASSSRMVVSPRQKAVVEFAAAPGSVLSSIAWTIKPMGNRENRYFLETNLCLDVDGEEYCFTGVEDFTHCAFYTPCKTAYSSLVPIAGDGYMATRYFPPSSAPVLRDGRIAVRFQAPDVGTVLEMQVRVRVRNADARPIGQSE